jgi:hypothetical protein
MNPIRKTVTDVLDEIKLQLRVMERITATHSDMYEACRNISLSAIEIKDWADTWCKFIEDENREE